MTQSVDTINNLWEILFVVKICDNEYKALDKESDSVALMIRQALNTSGNPTLRTKTKKLLMLSVCRHPNLSLGSYK